MHDCLEYGNERRSARFRLSLVDGSSSVALHHVPRPKSTESRLTIVPPLRMAERGSGGEAQRASRISTHPSRAHAALARRTRLRVVVLPSLATAKTTPANAVTAVSVQRTASSANPRLLIPAP